MRLPSLLTAAGLFAVVALGHSQTPPPPPIPAPSPAGPPVQGVLFGQPAPFTPPAVPSPSPIVPTPSPVPPPTPPPSTPQIETLRYIEPLPEQTVDQLIAELERLKTQKAEIEKQEQAVKDTLAKKLADQHERLKKLGVEKKEEPKPVTKADKPSVEWDDPQRTSPLIPR